MDETGVQRTAHSVANAVECRSDTRYAERPTALTWQGRRLEITHILHRWRSPTGVGFQVRTTSGEFFELFYAEANDDWQIQPR